MSFVDWLSLCFQRPGLKNVFSKFSIPMVAALTLFCVGVVSSSLAIKNAIDADNPLSDIAVLLQSAADVEETVSPELSVFDIEPAAGDDETVNGDVGDQNVAATESNPPVIIQGTVDGLQAAAKELTERFVRLRELEQDVEVSKAALETVREKLLEDIGRMSLLRDEVAALLAGLDEEDERKLQRLVKTYESMKAKKAAVIFNQLDLPVLIPVIERMREAKIAAILAAMDPIKAKVVTTRLAQKTKRPELPDS